MFKTNSRVSSEAETLYAEHKTIHGAIAKNSEYVDSAEEMLDSMISSGTASSGYVDDMESDIYSVKRSTSRLEKEATENVIKADEHLRVNPQLFDIAVKSARLDGVDIKIK